MADYDNKQFTEEVLALYAEALRQRLPRVKFMLDVGDAVRDAISQRVYRLVKEYTPAEVSFSLDGYMRGDGSMDQDMLAEAVANGLSVPMIDAVEDELKPEEDDPLKRIGAGQLWLMHRVIPVPFTLGGAQAHFAQDAKIGLFGQTWYDMKVMKNKFMAKTEWGLARSGEVKKEVLDIGAL